VPAASSLRPPDDPPTCTPSPVAATRPRAPSISPATWPDSDFSPATPSRSLPVRRQSSTHLRKPMRLSVQRNPLAHVPKQLHGWGALDVTLRVAQRRQPIEIPGHKVDTRYPSQAQTAYSVGRVPQPVDEDVAVEIRAQPRLPLPRRRGGVTIALAFPDRAIRFVDEQFTTLLLCDVAGKLNGLILGAEYLGGLDGTLLTNGPTPVLGNHVLACQTPA